VILVDSTVWIDLLRARQRKPVERLRHLIDLGEAAVAPVIVQEILQGAVEPAGWNGSRIAPPPSPCG
jgi:predicted nucleic acid-binding protein